VKTSVTVRVWLKTTRIPSYRSAVSSAGNGMETLVGAGSAWPDEQTRTRETLETWVRLLNSPAVPATRTRSPTATSTALPPSKTKIPSDVSGLASAWASSSWT
jgi:hypothetical protein